MDAPNDLILLYCSDTIKDSLIDTEIYFPETFKLDLVTYLLLPDLENIEKHSMFKIDMLKVFSFDSQIYMLGFNIT